jgi:excisionase family DNA binding protein
MTRNDEHQEAQMPSKPGEESSKFGYEEAARYTGIKKSTLYNLVMQRRVPHHRIGRRFVLFDAQDLSKWLAARKVAAK